MKFVRRMQCRNQTTLKNILSSLKESLKITYSADLFCLIRDADAMRLKQQKAAEKKAAEAAAAKK